MIERIFAFCFGSQQHKYVVLLMSATIAASATLAVSGLEAAPASAPAIAVLTVLLALPISAVFRFFTREALDRRLLHAFATVAVYLSRASAEVVESFLGDLGEFYAVMRERVGRGRAIGWYLFEILHYLYGISWIGGFVRFNLFVLALLVSLMYGLEFISPDNFVPTGFEILGEFAHTAVTVLGLLIITNLLLHHFAVIGERLAGEFARFRSEKRLAGLRKRVTSPKHPVPPSSGRKGPKRAPKLQQYLRRFAVSRRARRRTP